MSRLRAADGGGAAAMRAKLPLVRCEDVGVFKVAGRCFYRELNGFRVNLLGRGKWLSTALGDEGRSQKILIQCCFFFVFFFPPLSAHPRLPVKDFHVAFCQYHYSDPPPGVSLMSFYYSNSAGWLFFSFHISGASSRHLPWFNSEAIKYGREKPVSVLLKQFSMAQGHGSNISFPLSPACSASGPCGRAEENSSHSHVRPFDWLLYLGAGRMEAGLTDWCS